MTEAQKEIVRLNKLLEKKQLLPPGDETGTPAS
jgi:hypothetical protein